MLGWRCWKRVCRASAISTLAAPPPTTSSRQSSTRLSAAADSFASRLDRGRVVIACSDTPGGERRQQRRGRQKTNSNYKKQNQVADYHILSALTASLKSQHSIRHNCQPYFGKYTNRQQKFGNIIIITTKHTMAGVTACIFVLCGYN